MLVGCKKGSVGFILRCHARQLSVGKYGIWTAAQSNDRSYASRHTILRRRIPVGMQANIQGDADIHSLVDKSLEYPAQEVEQMEQLIAKLHLQLQMSHASAKGSHAE